MEEDLLYDDFNGIRITSKKFYAGDKAYALHKISKINLQRVTPHKTIGLTLFIVGLVTILIGSLEVLGSTTIAWNNSFWLLDYNFVSIAIGVISIIIAVVRMMLYPDEYAVEIETIDGVKEAIKSDSRKYAARLAASLKRAYYRQDSRKIKEPIIA